MRVKKYVLDVNIFVSYFISNQQQKLASIIADNDLEIYYCNELLIEIERVLTYHHLKKFKINVKEVVMFIKTVAYFYSLTKPIKVYIEGDNDDSYIIALALQTNSGFVTSGDRHILDQKEALEKKYTKLKIITKSEFENKF